MNERTPKTKDFYKIAALDTIHSTTQSHASQ